MPLEHLKEYEQNYFYFLRVHAQVQASHGTHLEVKVNCEESVLASFRVGPEDQILVIRLGSKCPNPLSHHASLLEHF